MKKDQEFQKVRGVGGLFFKCQEPEKLAAWYKEHLGFELAAPFCAAFTPGKHKEGDQTIWGAFSADTTYFEPSSQDFMFNFIVDDVEAMLSQVEAAGAKRAGEVVKEEYGVFGWFIDPEGFKVELWHPIAEGIDSQ